MLREQIEKDAACIRGDDGLIICIGQSRKSPDAEEPVEADREDEEMEYAEPTEAELAEAAAMAAAADAGEC